MAHFFLIAGQKMAPRPWPGLRYARILYGRGVVGRPERRLRQIAATIRRSPTAVPV